MSNHHDYKLKVTRIGLLKHFSLWKSRFGTRNIVKLKFAMWEITVPPQIFAYNFNEKGADSYFPQSGNSYFRYEVIKSHF